MPLLMSMGFLPINYLMHARVKKAEKLLATTDYSLSVISIPVVFPPPAIFPDPLKK